MYTTFLSAKQNLQSCSNYDVSTLETDSFKELCSLPSPDLKEFSQNKQKIIQSMQFNIAPLLCYTIFHNVYAVCHPDTKVAVKKKEISPPGDQFCNSIPEIALPETCTHWLKEDENHSNKDDCFLVNEVVKTVLNNKKFCENKCLVPEPDSDKNGPVVNPLCISLLSSSLTLAHMSPKGEVESQEKKPSSSSKPQPDPITPPGLKKKDEVESKDGQKSNKPEEETDAPKSGEEVLDNNMDEVNANTTVDLEVNSTSDVSTNKVKATEPATADNAVKTTAEKILEADDKSLDKINNTQASQEDKQLSSKASTTDSDIDVELESSGSFSSTMGNEFVPSSSSAKVLEQEEDKGLIDVDQEEENKKDIKKSNEVKNNDMVDAEPLISKEDKANSDVSKGNTENTEEEKVYPTKEKADELVETKYTNSMKTGPEIDEQSSFFGYFILLSIVAIIAYLVFHNKQKILALILEGRRRQGNRRRSGGREYRKLDSNLEDTMDPGKETSLRQVIY